MVAGAGRNWQEAHNSPGEIVTGTRWAMAEGRVGRTERQTQTYVLIANTSAFAGTARVTLVFEDGTTAEKLVLAAGEQPDQRAASTPSSRPRPAGASARSIETQGATPAQIVVERAMYSNANGVIWAAGTNALATRLQ